jgi:phosphate acetyltransferase
MLKAASDASREKFADIVLLGKPDELRKLAAKDRVDLSKVEILDHAADKDLNKYAKEYFEKRKHKGVTEEEAMKVVSDPLFFGASMLRAGRVDGMVAGAVNSSANVLRSVLHIIGTSPGLKTLSSCFVIVIPEIQMGLDGAFIFADCAVVPNPTAEQLADIAIAAARSARMLLGCDPIVAMLSFSTKGSSKDPSVDKVIEATRILKEVRKVDFVVDGELQLDAALVESVGKKKAPGSPVAGKANVLIFPDLNSGNIAYKLAQRLAKGDAYGPLLQGAALPVSDLSRGCSAEDITQTIAIVVAQTE